MEFMAAKEMQHTIFEKQVDVDVNLFESRRWYLEITDAIRALSAQDYLKCTYFQQQRLCVKLESPILELQCTLCSPCTHTVELRELMDDEIGEQTLAAALAFIALHVHTFSYIREV